MNIQLNWTVPAGQTWKYRLSNGKNYRIYSSSKNLLYELTDDNLVITARKEAQDGDNIVLVNTDNQYTTYILNKVAQSGGDVVNRTYTAYYGNVDSEDQIPSSYTAGQSKVITGGVFEYTATKNVTWFALPRGLKIEDVIEIWFETSWKGDIPELQESTLVGQNNNEVIVGDYQMYHITFDIIGSHNTNLKITYTT